MTDWSCSKKRSRMKTTQDFTKECSVLFIDDVDHVRELVEKMLRRLFKTVYVAANGEEGLNLYKEKSPDLIITDINMPVMDGIEMIEVIRTGDIEQKIIILSAHNDHSFFEKAVNLKIDGYLIKPIDMQMLMKAVDNSVRLIVQKRELETLNRQLEKRVEEEVEKNSQKDKLLISMLTSFLESSPNPIIAFEDNMVTFANNRFLTLCGRSKDEIIGSNYKIDALFEKRKGFLHSLSEMNNEEPHRNKVSISSAQGRSIFTLLESEIPSFGENKLQVYTFNDITVNEYQKLKIEQYSERLEDYIKAFRRAAPSPESKEIVPPAKPDIAAPVDMNAVRTLDDTEHEVLTKSHQGHEIASDEYAKEIDSYVLEEIQELTDLENEINEELLDMEESQEIGHVRTIAERLGRYASTISLLFEFADLSYAVKSLSDLLNTIDMESLDQSKQRKINLYLNNIVLDLISWRKTIFIDQNTKDIHYLDSSLFSAILQLELVLNEDKSAVDGGDDLELF